MRNKGAIIAEVEMKNSIVKNIYNKAITLTAKRVFAEEAGETTTTTTTGEEEPVKATINYEDLIAKARKEEKDKQYSKIKKLEDQIKVLTEQHNADLIKVEELKTEIKVLNDKLTNAGKGDSEEIKGLKDSIKALEKEKKSLEDKVKDAPKVSEEELRNQIREELEEEYEVKLYKTTKLAEHKDDLLVPELVFGSTKEEIDNSLAIALQRSNEILEKAGGKKKKQSTTTRATSPSISGAQDTNEYSMDYIATLDVRSPEYKEFRRKMGLDR